ncbi:hypothetical protein T459_09561 [Capsicum annuum]|uniref:F-box domain-containing protein n=1 Tax=Capsicum annuum TaxID=4072 RepID=A0A2G2ZZP6_CAPAN|nr:hypothetical protein T459_09561 [Capsicum annuum]
MEKNYLLWKVKQQKKNYRSNTVINQINSVNEEEFFIPCRCTQQKKNESVPYTAEEINTDTAEDIHFPEEIVMNILSRLPVRSLQRFKCVSPFWSALISDHYFIMKHLNHGRNDLNSQKLLTANHQVGFNSFSLSSPVQVIEDEQRLDGPPNYSLSCCCDGLALLSFSDEKTDLMSFLLWNPSTRGSILLPSRHCGFRFWVFGLGYDATSDDYKILAAYLDAGSLGDVSVQILSLKSGSWRKIDKYPTGMRPASGYSDRAMSSLEL